MHAKYGADVIRAYLTETLAGSRLQTFNDWHRVFERLPGTLGVALLAAACGGTTDGQPQGVAEVCDNGADDDGDQALDCDDSDCFGELSCGQPLYAMPYETDCADSADDDGDGRQDCADTDCSDDPACRTTGTGGTGGVGGTGGAAGEAGLGGEGGIYGIPLEDCENGADDDGDGAIDCADIECASADPCGGELYGIVMGGTGGVATGGTGGTPTGGVGGTPLGGMGGVYGIPLGGAGGTGGIATGGIGGTGAVGGIGGMGGAYAIPLENCTNRIDDNHNGAVDCLDSDCFGAPQCAAVAYGIPMEDCATVADDDGDTLVNCADPDCDASPLCQTQTDYGVPFDPG